MKTYRINEEMRLKLKKPIGDLITGGPDKTMAYLKRIVSMEKPPKLFAIGDHVSSNMIKHGIKADLYVVDNKIMRENIRPVPIQGAITIKVANPPGTITPEANDAIRRAANSTSLVRIVVDGEEDLLTLPAVKFAPKRSIVVYGQPHVGIVIVRVTGEKQKEVKQILKLCEVHP